MTPNLSNAYFKNKAQRKQNTTVYLNNKPLEQVNEIKYLGKNLDQSLGSMNT